MKLACVLFASLGVLGLSATAATAQFKPSHESRTTDGCVYFAFWPSQPGDVATWSQACERGKPITGRGVLIYRYVGDDGVTYEDRDTGSMVGGYWQGDVSLERRAAGRLVSSKVTNFTMGCYSTDPSCTPGRAVGIR